MDVLRHTGRAELASFLGGSNAGADASQWRFAPYTEADLEKQLAQAPQLYGAARPAGGRRRRRLRRRDQRLHRRRQPRPATEAGRVHAAEQADGTVEADRRDRDRLAGRRHLRPGGGNELNSALTMQAFVERMGKKAGRKAWRGLPLQERPRGADDGLQALPLRDPQRLRQARPGAAGPRQRHASPSTRQRLRRARAARPRRVGQRLQAAIEAAGHASNWELVSAKESATGHPIAVMGPQVGYYVPQILMEEDLHGPGIDARGAAFAGRQPLRRARPRPRLRLERDDGDLRQRRHLRRGPLQGQLPLPLPRQVPGDGKAGKERELDAERDRLDAGRLADADRLPHRARDRLRARQGAAARRSPSSASAAPTSTRPTR